MKIVYMLLAFVLSGSAFGAMAGSAVISGKIDSWDQEYVVLKTKQNRSFRLPIAVVKSQTKLAEDRWVRLEVSRELLLEGAIKKAPKH